MKDEILAIVLKLEISYIKVTIYLDGFRFLLEDFLKDEILAIVLKLEINYNQVIIYLDGFWFLLEDFFFEDYINFAP